MRGLMLLFSVVSTVPAFAAVSMQVSTLYWNFEGTKAAKEKIYGFRNVTLERQAMWATWTASPRWTLNFNTSVSRNYAETYFFGQLYKDQTEGLNDSAVNAQYIHLLSEGWVLMPEFGVSAPTGSITEKNQNNRQFNYPYNMQLGSGTFDMPMAVTMMRVGSNWIAYARAQWIKRFGRNSQDYRLGDEYTGIAGLDYARKKWLTPGLRGLYRHRDAISGADKTYGRNVFVEYYHHAQVNWDVSAILKSSVDLLPGLKLGFEAGAPLVQGLINYDDVVVDSQYYGKLDIQGQF